MVGCVVLGPRSMVIAIEKNSVACVMWKTHVMPCRCIDGTRQI